MNNVGVSVIALVMLLASFALNIFVWVALFRHTQATDTMWLLLWVSQATSIISILLGSALKGGK